MNRIAVYTCITGSYDSVKEFPEFREDCIDYLLFTNNRTLNSSFWKIVYIDDDGLDNVRLARKIKTIGHPLLKRYEVTVWMDGASFARRPISEFLAACCDLERYSLVGFRHRERDCIYDEAIECLKVKKDCKDVIASQIEKYRSEGYPKHNGLIESTVIVRRGNDISLENTMDAWFKEIQAFSFRDQLSFNYVARKTGLSFKLLDLNVFDNDFFGWQKHAQASTKKELGEYHAFFGSDDSLTLEGVVSGVFDRDGDLYSAEIVCPMACDKFKFEFAQFSGIAFSEFEVVCPNGFSKNLVNWRRYHDVTVFDSGVPTVFLEGNFHPGDRIRVKIRMHVLTIDELLHILYDFFLENIELRASLDDQGACKNDALSKFKRLFTRGS